MADLGRLFKNIESVVLSWGTEGLWFTTAEAIANMSSTGDEPWDVTRHTYIQSVSVTRLVFCLAYLCAEFRHSSTVGKVRTQPWVLPYIAHRWCRHRHYCRRP